MHSFEKENDELRLVNKHPEVNLVCCVISRL